jgi:hypothetical protein
MYTHRHTHTHTYTCDALQKGGALSRHDSPFSHTHTHTHVRITHTLMRTRALPFPLRQDVSAYNLQLKQFVEQFHREGPFALQTADPQAIRQAYALITQQQVGSLLCGWGWGLSHCFHSDTRRAKGGWADGRASSLPPHGPTFHHALRILPSSSEPLHCAG